MKTLDVSFSDFLKSISKISPFSEKLNLEMYEKFNNEFGKDYFN